MQSVKHHLGTLVDENFTIQIPTHTPVIHFYQAKKSNYRYQLLLNSKYKFICGTNILSNNMMHTHNNWDVNIFNVSPYKNSVLMGVGMGSSNTDINYYTKTLYNKIFHKDYYHSCRDEKTTLFVKKLGYKALNTGCPTMWSLTKDVCQLIPIDKTNSVVFTLTDYDQSEELDFAFLNILKNNYRNLFFWPQGIGDLDYFKKLNFIHPVTIINPNIDSLSRFFHNNNCDYIGTRLHAGIFAMQHSKRAIILVVDNRAREINRSFNINCIERDEINILDKKINDSFVTDIKIDTLNIQKWLHQFI